MAWWSSWQSYGSRSKDSWPWKRQSGADWNKWGGRSEKEGWHYKFCGTNNWGSRHSCRDYEGKLGLTAANSMGCSNAGIGDAEAGDPKMVAAAKVTTLEEKIAMLGDDPIMATAKLRLGKELQKQQKLAKDTRSTAKKLDQNQGWVEHESRRIEAKTKQLVEQQQNRMSGISNFKWKLGRWPN